MPPEIDEIEQARMTFGEHLEELRSRVVKALVGFLIAFIGCFLYNERLIELVCDPLFWVLKINDQPPALFPRRVTEVFFTSLKVSAIAAFVIASPWIMYQVWAFIASGLYPQERKVVYLYAPLSLIFFLAGAVFFYLLVLPIALNYFVSFGKDVKFEPAGGPPFNIRMLWGQVREPEQMEPPHPPPVELSAVEKGTGRRLDLTVPVEKLSLSVPIVAKSPSKENDWTFPEGTIDGRPLALHRGLIWYDMEIRDLFVAADFRETDPNTLWDRARNWVTGSAPAERVRAWDIRKVAFQSRTPMSQAFTLDDYVSFVAWMTLLFGIAFQVPLVVMFSIRIGAVERSALAGIRRYIFFSCVIVSAVITPTPDPMTQMMLAVPMYLLYELGLLLSLFLAKPLEAPAEGEGEEEKE
jgi:sec-independent protein translocase protein TatC